MKPRSAFTGTYQLFQAHWRARLAHRIDWPRFDATVADNDRSDGGAPVKAIAMRVGLHNPKIAFNESHEMVVARGFENPDGQYFCGFTHLQPMPHQNGAACAARARRTAPRATPLRISSRPEADYFQRRLSS